ncbi:hypothetical protein RTP6_003089 [Batrachochytrium dendrobatidis]
MYKAIALTLTLISTTVVSNTRAVATSGTADRCTSHPYEQDLARFGAATYDNAPGWCGIRYSSLDITRIVAVHGLDESMCGQCIEFKNAAGGPAQYVLAVDQKADPGLDLAITSLKNAFPGQDPLNPQKCDWKVVDQQFCAGICHGSSEECTPGKRNLLPAYLLPRVQPTSNQLRNKYVVPNVQERSFVSTDDVIVQPNAPVIDTSQTDMTDTTDDADDEMTDDTASELASDNSESDMTASTLQQSIAAQDPPCDGDSPLPIPIPMANIASNADLPPPVAALYNQPNSRVEEDCSSSEIPLPAITTVPLSVPSPEICGCQDNHSVPNKMAPPVLMPVIEIVTTPAFSTLEAAVTQPPIVATPITTSTEFVFPTLEGPKFVTVMFDSLSNDKHNGDYNHKGKTRSEEWTQTRNNQGESTIATTIATTLDQTSISTSTTTLDQTSISTSTTITSSTTASETSQLAKVSTSTTTAKLWVYPAIIPFVAPATRVIQTRVPAAALVGPVATPDFLQDTYNLPPQSTATVVTAAELVSSSWQFRISNALRSAPLLLLAALALL